jgi:hypothetical protein
MTSGRLGKKKKRKLHEFQFTVLSLDPKRSRTDLAAASAGETVEQIVKFAGVEYRCVFVLLLPVSRWRTLVG